MFTPLSTPTTRRRRRHKSAPLPLSTVVVDTIADAAAEGSTPRRRTRRKTAPQPLPLAEPAIATDATTTPRRRASRKTKPELSAPTSTLAPAVAAFAHPLVAPKKEHYSRRHTNIPAWQAPESLDRTRIAAAKEDGLFALRMGNVSLDDSQRDHIRRGVGRKDHWTAVAVYVGS